MGSKKTDREKRRQLRIRLESEGASPAEITKALAAKARQQRVRRSALQPLAHGDRCGQRFCLLEDEAIRLVRLWFQWGWRAEHWRCKECSWFHMQPVRL